MAVRVIYSVVDGDFWVEAARRMANKHDWQPVYWIGFASADKVRETFPETIFHSTIDAIRGIPAKSFTDTPLLPLGEELLREMAVDEAIIYPMMERMDPGRAFSYQERRRLYHAYLQYWITVLQQVQPDLAFMPISPHMGFDYVLYRLCIRQGIKTLMFERVSAWAGKIFPIEQFEYGSNRIRELYQQKLLEFDTTPAPLSAEGEEYLERVRSASHIDAMPAHSKRQYEQTVSQRNPRQVIRESTMRLVHPIWKLATRAIPANYLKEVNKPIEESQFIGLKWLTYRYRADFIKWRLKRYYDKLASYVDLTKPYVLVALNYQPERTTSPLGGVFVDQTLMVKVIASSLPEGWQVYVKDHPRSLWPGSRGHMMRSKQYYNDLVNIPNVKLIPINWPTFDLIDHAAAVATVTNTVGWEAVVRGKPALIFGHSWYQDCAGVFYTPNAKECAEALQKIADGYMPDPMAVRTFIHVIEEISYQGYVDEKLAPYVNISPEQNVDTLVSALEAYESGLQGLSTATPQSPIR